MRTIVTLVVLLLATFSLNLTAQPQSCGTHITAKEAAAMQRRIAQLPKTMDLRSGAIKEYPIRANIISNDRGRGGISRTDILDAVDRANDAFRAANIQFFVCEFNEIRSSDMYTFHYPEDEVMLTTGYYRNNVINIYFANTIYDTNDRKYYGGYAYFPGGGPDLIMMTKAITRSPNNGLIHELGHYFNLLHTHETATGAESVRRVDCNSAGDQLCDTPADPGLSGSNVDDCKYTGTARDVEGEEYTPDVDNFMSYAPEPCWKSFSNGQLYRMNLSSIYDRNYLFCNTSGLKTNLRCVNPGRISQAGNQVSLSGLVVENEGDVLANRSKVELFLSADQQFNPSVDHHLGAFDLPALTPTERSTLSHQAQIPSSVPSGNYYVILVLDSGDIIIESNERDNICLYENPKVFVGGALKPNLTCSEPGQFTISGNQLHITGVKIINAGLQKSVRSRVGFYLSSNTTITSSDAYVGYQFLPEINSGEEATISVNLNIPTNLSVREYYLGMIIDYTRLVDENDETDNVCYFASPKVSIKPNLTCGTIGRISQTGNVIQVTNFQVRNAGPAAAGVSTVEFFLSTNTNITSSVISVGHVSVPSIRPLTRYSLNTNLTIPNNVPPGEYYLGMVLDSKREVNESSEYDNSCYYGSPKVIVGEKAANPNLTCGGFGKISQSGKYIYVDDFEIHNVGTATAGKSHVSFYLSTNKDISDRYDRYLGYTEVPVILPGQKWKNSLKFPIPKIKSGFYYVGMVVDAKFQVNEIREDDNSCASAIPWIYVSPSVTGASTAGAENTEISASPTEIGHKKATTELMVMPNPTKGPFEVVLNSDESLGNSRLELIGLDGRVLQAVEVPEGYRQRIPLDLSDQPKGVYYLRWKTPREVLVKPVVLTQ